MQRRDEKRNKENRKKEKQRRIKIKERGKKRMDEIRGRERRLGNSEAKIRENLNVYLEGRKTSLAIGEKDKEKNNQIMEDTHEID